MDMLLIFGCGMLATYLLIGLLINILIYIWSKMKGMDRFEESWDIIINSFSGFIYFLMSGMFFWMPVTIMFLLEKLSNRDSSEEDEEVPKRIKEEIVDEGIYTDEGIWRFFRHPYRSYRSWFYRYHK